MVLRFSQYKKTQLCDYLKKTVYLLTLSYLSCYSLVNSRINN